MFFTFSTFAKINIVVSMSAAGWISEGSNLLLPNIFFFSFSNPIKFFQLWVTAKSKLLGLKFK